MTVTATSAVLVSSLGVMPAQAKNCWAQQSLQGSGITTGCREETPGQPGTPGQPAGSGKPSCTLIGKATFCRGTDACYYTEWHPPYIVPANKPAPDAELKVRTCIPAGGSWLSEPVWLDPGTPLEPPLAAQAREAVGRLTPPRATLQFNPPRRTVVNIPTWWWTTGLPATPLRGTSAFGLVAIATPDHLDIEPGDGTTLTCPWTTTPTQASRQCTHTYLRASITATASAEGQPAYLATATPTWTITYTDTGTPVTIPDAPTTITGPPATTPVPVTEIQNLVQPNTP
ncbi:MAG: hypothetical protein ACRC35_04260 [Angustibacter sp.]